MSNNIKFRIWNGKEFLKGRGLDDICICYMGDVLVLEGNELCLAGDEYIPQRFTGLKDKTGREIYEGDIITTRHFDDWHDTEGFDVVQAVKWCNIHVGFRGFTKRMLDGKSAGNGLPNPITIIGNIFETPELLK